MNKITFKKAPFKLKEDKEILGIPLSFKGIDKDGKDIDIKEFNDKVKVVSTFPKLNTSVCDNQTIKIAEFAKKYTDIEFISITMDDTEVIKQWCADHNLENLKVITDSKYNEFGNATGLLIPKLKMLARGFIVIDKDNKVMETLYKKELTDDPEFDKLEDKIKSL